MLRNSGVTRRSGPPPPRLMRGGRRLARIPHAKHEGGPARVSGQPARLRAQAACVGARLLRAPLHVRWRRGSAFAPGFSLLHLAILRRWRHAATGTRIMVAQQQGSRRFSVRLVQTTTRQPHWQALRWSFTTSLASLLRPSTAMASLRRPTSAKPSLRSRLGTRWAPNTRAKPDGSAFSGLEGAQACSRPRDCRCRGLRTRIRRVLAPARRWQRA